MQLFGRGGIYRELSLTWLPLHSWNDGLDTMILLAWVVRAFCTANLQQEPFVLHYWDPSASNIMASGNYQIR